MKSKFLTLDQVKINDCFWSQKQQNVCDHVIGYQLDAISDNIPGAEPSHAIENFKIAAGELKGEFYGWFFQDSDVAKWIEAASYSLAISPDDKLIHEIDKIIDIIERAQQPDGYLHTYVTVKQPDKRFKNLLEWHELYCAGHMIEAAVAYYNVTGKDRLLQVVCRLADYIITVFGYADGQIKGYPGHEEVELALYKLYETTGEKKYFDLAKYFIDERGQRPFYFDLEESYQTHVWNKKGHDPYYQQSHLPVRQQDTAEGHSVRAMYLYCGMADVAYETADTQLFNALEAIWENMTSRRMYITGGIGSQAQGERFTIDYDLPNDRVYAETCASIGAFMWAKRMLKINNHSKYADLMETQLYNTILSGISLSGTEYFYVNPLEVNPNVAKYRADMNHIKTQRVKWFGCACCPPNVARILTSLSEYIYSQNQNQIYTHLYIASTSEFDIDGNKVVITQTGNYPWQEQILFTIGGNASFTLNLRIPKWCEQYSLSINGQKATGELQNGYLKVNNDWCKGDTITLELPMPIKIMRSNSKVPSDAGKVVLMRGPIVYCIEQVDNGEDLHCLILDSSQPIHAQFKQDELRGVNIVRAKGFRLRLEDGLYSDKKPEMISTEIKFVPYYTWGNRGEGEMRVWVNEKL